MEPTGPDPITVPAPPQPLSASDLTRAASGGLIGAILGGVIWGFIVAATDYELGIVATGIGLLAGFGVVLLCRNKHGMPLQVIAAAARSPRPGPRPGAPAPPRGCASATAPPTP